MRRAFDAATDRLRGAQTQAEVEDELSNLLHHLYRLGELCRWRLGTSARPKLPEQDFGELLGGSDDLRAARAARWARKLDTHEIVVVEMATDPDTYSSDLYRHDFYGVIEWKPLTVTDPDPTTERHKDYADVLCGEPVLDMTRCAFNALADLLQSP